MLVLLIVGMIGIFVGQALAASERAHQSVDQTVESQQNLRAVLDMLERDLRHAAFMMPEAASVCGIDATTGPDTLFVADAAVIDPQDDIAEYAGPTITAGSVSTGTGTLTLSSLVVENDNTRAALDTDANGTNDSDFRDGGGVIIVGSDPALGTTCGVINSVSPGSNQINVTLVGGITGSAAPYRIVPANRYQIVAGSLEWNGFKLAGNVEDFQVAWIFDPDGDSIIDPGEVYGTGGGTAYTRSAEDAADIREIRVNLVARTRMEAEDFTEGRPQIFENRNGGAFVSDGFRRRSVTSTIRLRNVGFRE
jgi:Tfp pilus assembly protein PilW